MGFTKRLHAPIMQGEVTCSIRIWQRPRVKVGGRYGLGPGAVHVTSIREIGLHDITPALARAPYQAPRTPDGQPDLQGEWTNITFTPLERPKAFAGPIATPAEAAAWVARIEGYLMNKPPPPKPGAPPPKPSVGNSEWFDAGVGLIRIDGKLRSSIITDPVDGKLPYNTFGQRTAAEVLRHDDEVFDGPEDRANDERCLMGGAGPLAPPMMPPGANATYQILQPPGLVVIQTEMIHDVRVIRLKAPHEDSIAKWFGDSTGHWEGETLVVETVNQHPLSVERFEPGDAVLLISPAAKVVERFTRISPTEIRYAFTVEDPALNVRPWSGEVMFTATRQPIYEYACHEGNYGHANILRGARRKEQEEAAKAKAPAP
jgi:hypothetical protein